MYQQIIAYGRAPIGPCFFQEYLEILQYTKKMSFDKIFDLTAGVYFNFYNIINRRTPPGGTSKFEQISGTDVTAC